jgi:hypothetical protein
MKASHRERADAGRTRTPDRRQAANATPGGTGPAGPMGVTEIQAMVQEDLAQTLDELLAFVDARLTRRTLPDGRELVWPNTRRLTREEAEHLFLLDQFAGVQCAECGLRLPALLPHIRSRESHLPYTHLTYQSGPGLMLLPTRAWLAEIKAIRAVAKAAAQSVTAAAEATVQEERLPQEDWMPAQKAVARANQEGVTITLPTVSKWKDGAKTGLKTRMPTLPGRHRWEVEYHSLLLMCHQSAVTSGKAEPCEGSFDQRIHAAKTSRLRHLD